jgi:hypothetical protein
MKEGDQGRGAGLDLPESGSHDRALPFFACACTRIDPVFRVRHEH